MLKAVFAVIAGYIVMALFVMVTSVVAFMAIRVDGAFQPGTYYPSLAWIVVILALSLLSAIVGGYVCAAIAPTGAAPKVLAGLILVLGLIFAWPALNPAADTGPIERMADVPALQAMGYGRPPAWVALLTPILGAAGVMIGASLRKRR